MQPLRPLLAAQRPLALALALAALAAGGCGGAGGNATSGRTPQGQASTAGAARGGHGRLTGATGGVAGYRLRAGATTTAPGGRLFSPASLWNRQPASGAPLDPGSQAIVAALSQEVAREEEERRGPWINTSSYGVPLLTVPAGQPTARVQLDHAPDAALSSAWSAVPLPDGARPAAGSDGYLVVWQPSSDRMWEFWRLNRQADGWHAAWGGAIMRVSENRGVYGADAWPGAKPWWGASASSLPLAAGAITIDELRRGEIDHALAISLPDIRAGVFASPARRTDGRSDDPSSLPEGARLRLDPRVDLSRLAMPPVTRAIATAAQRYGIIVRDFAGNVTFSAQDPTPTGSDPYHGPNGLYGGRYPDQLLASLPWSHLQVLRMDLHRRP